MKKAELIHAISKASGDSKVVVERVLEAFASTVKDATLLDDKKVSLPGFGAFSRRQRKGRDATSAMPAAAPSVSVGFRAFEGAKQKL